MMSCIPPWKEWITLDKETREYYRHQFMVDTQEKLENLENRKKFDLGASTVSGTFGGFMAVLFKDLWFK